MAWKLSTKEIENLYKTSIDEGLADEQITANKVQYGNNSYSLDTQSLSPSQQCRVLRNKSHQNVPLSEIVAGDVIFLSAGDICPADSVIVSIEQPVTVDMGNFSGETDPVPRSSTVDPNAKEVDAAPNVIYASVPIISGDCKVIAFAVGSKTMIGNLLANTEAPAPKKAGLKEARYSYGTPKLLSNLLKQNIMVRTIECLSALPKVNKIVIFEPDVANSTDLQEFNQHASSLGIKVVVCTSHQPDSESVKKFVEAFKAPETVFTQDSAGTLQRIKCGLSPNDKLSEIQDVEGVCTVGATSADAQAIHYSFVGVCLGTCGTTVAKEAAHMILLTDNLNDLVKGIDLSKKQSGCCVL